MMKINLLGIPKQVGRESTGEAAVASEAIIISGAILVVLTVAALIFYYVWSNEITQHTKDLAIQTTRQTELATYKKQNDGYLESIAHLEQRQKTTQTLLDSRIGPVELMRSVGTAADKSNDLYLTSVTSEAGRLVMKGESNSVNSIATFLVALAQTGSFEDVQFRQSFEDDAQGRLNYKFNVDCVYRPGGSSQPAAAATAPGAVTPPAAGKPAAKPAVPTRKVGL